LPAMVRAVVRAPARRRESAGGWLGGGLAGLAEAEQEQVVLAVVLRQVASLLGHAYGAAFGPGRAFDGVGSDSLPAVELRNRLRQVAGLRLPATLVFDHPTPVEAARLILSLVGGTG
ncbi:hypothetical protein VM98_35710, partial [Streptomyces rubellomurinus subsp. indigoferus]